MPDPASSNDDALATVNQLLEQTIPRAHQMGVTFVEARPGHVRAEVPFEGNGNHFGVVYAGVIFTLAEVLGGALHFATFDVSTHYPLVRSLNIEFLAPGTGRLSASATIDEAEIERIRSAAVNGKVPFELVAEVIGEDGTLVARTRGDYQIRPYGT